MKNIIKNSYQAIFLSILTSIVLLFGLSLYKNSSAVEIPVHLQLRASRQQIIGHKIFSDDVVKYAYKSGARISNSASQNILNAGQKSGLAVGSEILEQRTKHSRTFNTNYDNKFIAEVISGDPQYYRDPNGEWWQAEYATTTRQAFDQQVAVSLGSRIMATILPRTYADTDTFYPDPNPEVSSLDGYASYSSSGAWSTVVGAN